MATQFLLKDKITATKYYESVQPVNSITGKNEVDVCLSLVNGVAPIVDGNTFLGGESIEQPGRNLKFTDPEGSISSETFAIGAIHSLNPNLQDEVVIDDIVIGLDINGDQVKTFISKDSLSEPFLNNYLKIESAKNLGPFDSTDELVQANFEDTNDALLSMAVNTAHNQIDKNGLLKIAEDTTYNNLYALGQNSSKYFTEDANTKQLNVHDLLSSNRITTNKVIFEATPDATPLFDTNFGTFKIYVDNPVITVTTSEDVSTIPLLVKEVTNATSSLPISLTFPRYEELFGSELYDGDSFEVEITKDPNTGFNFANSNDTNYAELNNSAIVDNVDYVKDVVGLTHTLEIVQQPMRIDSDLNNSNDNSSNFHLTTNGENLSSSNYNTDGEIILSFNAPNQRVSGNVDSAFEVVVDYASLDEELKTTQNVSYELVDYLLPTGNGQYGSLGDSNGASVYSELDDYYADVDLASSINVNNSVKLIKVTPSFELDNIKMYQLVNSNLGDLIPVDITASITNVANLPADTEFRTRLFSKKISDLDIQSVNGSNDLLIQDTVNPSINSNKWNLYFDSEYTNEYLMSSLLATSNTSNFPSIEKSASMITNNESLEVSLSYVSVTSSNSTGMLFDSVRISCDEVTTEISQQSLEFFNESSKVHYYEQMPSVSDNNGVVYKMVKYMITEQYQAKFMFPLSVFGNMQMCTPLLNSVITTYLYYSADTVITIGANNDTITASKNKILLPLIPSYITDLYKSTDAISLASDLTNTNVVLNFTINKKSLTPLNAVFQIKPNSTWEDIGNVIPDIDTYYGTKQSVKNLLGYTVNVVILPQITTNTDTTLQLVDEEYVIPLEISFDSLSLTVKGYEYPITNSLSVDDLKDPSYFLNNDLPVGNDMNLSVNYGHVLLQPNEYSISINVIDNSGTIATIEFQTSSFFGPFVVAKNSAPLFSMDKQVDTYSPMRIVKQGDESVSNGSATGVSSGVLDMSDGVKINYTNIPEQVGTVNFSLLPDKISVSNVGSAGTPAYISQLEYSAANSETVSIDYYRGYLNNGNSQTYKIVRKDLVSAKVKATNSYISDVSGVHVNKLHTINFNGTISIGITVKMLFSRLADSMLVSNKYIMPINVVSDSVKITRTFDGDSAVINKTLADYLLYDFENGIKLISKGIQSPTDLEYEILYKKANTKVYFVNDYKTNPVSISWPTEPIINLSLNSLDNGIYIDNVGENVNGWIFLEVNQDTREDSTSYFVYAPPYLHAEQATKYASNVFPFDIASNPSALKTVYFPVSSCYSFVDGVWVFKPFANTTNTNNVALTLDAKLLSEYLDSSKNMSVQTIDITGSVVKLTELKSNAPDVPSSNGPNHDGVLYYGTIAGLIDLSSNYLKFVSDASGVFTVSYTQDLGGFFQQIFGNTDVNHRDNIVINLGNSVLPDDTFYIHNQVLSGSKVNVYDVYQVNRNNTLELYLLKYVYETLIDYGSLPGNTYIRRFPFAVDALYYSKVSIPSVSLGDDINNVLQTVTKSNLTLDGNGNIVWKSKVSFAKKLTLQITPLTQAGAVDMVTLFFTDSEVPANYTVVKIPNAYEVVNGDGTYQTVITGLGKIKAQTLHDSTTPETVDIVLPDSTILSNYAFNNSTLYDTDIPLDVAPRSIDNILFNWNNV